MTPGFHGDPLLRISRDGSWPFVTVRDVTYRSGDGLVIVIPAGMATDLASIPPGLRWRKLIRQTALPGLLHDYLYTARGRQALEKALGRKLTREKGRALADRLFLEALEAVGVPRAVRTAMWLSVRLAGAARYKG